MMVGQGRYLELWDSGVWAAKLGAALSGSGGAGRRAWKTFRCEAEPCTCRCLPPKRSMRSTSVRHGTYLDGTFGRGGHSRAILARLGPQGRLIALDRDPQAEEAARAIADPRFSFYRRKFSQLDEVLAGKRVDGMLFDLGVSSPQLDDPARGFSFRADAPLDMRMDPTAGATAAQWLAAATQDEITEVIRSYGEERFAKQVAAAIVAARAREPVVRTRQLADLVAGAVRKREPGQDPATRTFQALRIHVNRELEEVSLMLPQGARPSSRRRTPRGDQLPFPGRPHRQAVHAATRAPGCAPRPPPARQRNATTGAQADRPCGASVGARDNKKPAGAKRHPQGGRAHRGRFRSCLSPLIPITESSPARGGETEPPPPRGSRRLRARARHFAAPGAQVLLRARARAGPRARARHRARAPAARGEHLGAAPARGADRGLGARHARAGPAPGEGSNAEPVNAATQGLVRFPVWRARLVLIGLAAAFLLLAGRALHLQALEDEFLQGKGDARYSRVIEVPATRGRIVDRHGDALAVSTPVKSIWAIPGDVEVSGRRASPARRAARRRGTRAAKAPRRQRGRFRVPQAAGGPRHGRRDRRSGPEGHPSASRVPPLLSRRRSDGAPDRLHRRRRRRAGRHRARFPAASRRQGRVAAGAQGPARPHRRGRRVDPLLAGRPRPRASARREAAEPRLRRAARTRSSSIVPRRAR